MQIKTRTLLWLVAGFIWSIFMGVMAISVGFGAEFPVINLVAQPFVCPNGQMGNRQLSSNPLPGTTYIQTNWYCVDKSTGQITGLETFPMSLYAGAIYGLLIFAIVLAAWYFNSRWDPAKASPETRKLVSAIQAAFAILIIVGLILIGMLPLFDALGATTQATATPNPTAVALARTYQLLTSGTPSDFDTTEKALAEWNGIPILPQAVSGRQVARDRYTFKVRVDSGTLHSFYDDNLKALGWKRQDDRWLGMQFTKDTRTLLVTYTPASDLEGWVVTLVLLP